MDNKSEVSFWSSTINNLPWKDFFTGVFIPVNLIHILLYSGKPFLGVIISILWCTSVCLVAYIIKKQIKVFAIVTIIMTLINVFTSFLKSHPILYLIVEALDNSFMGFIFLCSLFTSTPFILLFLSKDVVNKIPEHIRNSPYYLKAWKIITAVWGIAYIGSALLLLYLRSIQSHSVEIVDFCTSWPMVIVLLIFSGNFPVFYWKNI